MHIHVHIFNSLRVIAMFFKGIVSKLMIKFWMCQKCGKIKNYNLKNDYKCCKMITNTLAMITITK
jgi:predicted Zn-ribbon and HTH transcriptional regulator